MKNKAEQQYTKDLNPLQQNQNKGGEPMHQNIIELLQIEREAIIKEIAVLEELALSYSLIANTSEETKQRTKETNARSQIFIDKLKSKIEAIEAQQKAFDEKLNSIEDPELKEMATAYFINGQSCEAIGRKYYLERTTVYKRLKRYFDD